MDGCRTRRNSYYRYHLLVRHHYLFPPTSWVTRGPPPLPYPPVVVVDYKIFPLLLLLILILLFFFLSFLGFIVRFQLRCVMWRDLRLKCVRVRASCNITRIIWGGERVYARQGGFYGRLYILVPDIGAPYLGGCLGGFGFSGFSEAGTDLRGGGQNGEESRGIEISIIAVYRAVCP